MKYLAISQQYSSREELLEASRRADRPMPRSRLLPARAGCRGQQPPELNIAAMVVVVVVVAAVVVEQVGTCPRRDGRRRRPCCCCLMYTTPCVDAVAT